ncbi:DUF31 family putative serine protease [Ureaplasma ceti]
MLGLGVSILTTLVVAPIAAKFAIQNRNRILHVPNVATDKITNPVQEYANANSVSLLLSAKLNAQYYQNFCLHMDNNLRDYLNSMNLSLTPPHYYISEYPSDNIQLYEADTGTAWLVDYQTHTDSLRNLVTYYLATNIHVVNLTVTVKYPLFENYISHGVIGERPSGKTLSLQLPVNKDTVKSFTAYISNPLGERTSTNTKLPISTTQILSSYANDLMLPSEYWFELPNVNVTNKADKIVPLGIYNYNGTPPQFNKAPFKYANFSITSGAEVIRQGYINQNYQLETQTHAEYNADTRGEDFAILKSTFNPIKLLKWVEFNKSRLNANISNPALSLIAADDNLKNSLYYSWIHLLEMFWVTPLDSKQVQDRPKTYIQRVQALIAYLENIKTKRLSLQEEHYFWNHFIFSDQINSKEQLYVSGYPGVSIGMMNYVTFKTAKFSDAQPSYGNIQRHTIDYTWHGQMFTNPYNDEENYLAPGSNLGSGSSGSMVLNDRGQIVGIYWGAYVSGNVGIFTPIFTRASSDNLIARLLKYEQNNFQPNQDNVSGLTQLFLLMKQFDLIR